MKYSHNGLIYSYVLLVLHLSCWYYLRVRLPKWNFLFFIFEEIWGGFHENLHFSRRLEEIWGKTSKLRYEEIWGGMATLILERKKNYPGALLGVTIHLGDVKILALHSCSYSTFCVKARLLEFMYSLFYLKQMALVPLEQNEGYQLMKILIPI